MWHGCQDGHQRAAKNMRCGGRSHKYTNAHRQRGKGGQGKEEYS